MIKSMAPLRHLEKIMSVIILHINENHCLDTIFNISMNGMDKDRGALILVFFVNSVWHFSFFFSIHGQRSYHFRAVFLRFFNHGEGNMVKFQNFTALQNPSSQRVFCKYGEETVSKFQYFAAF